MEIHPTAVNSPSAKIGKGVCIGPYSVIGDDAVIGDDCWIDTHVKIASSTTLGKRCRVYMGAVVGEEPQDHRFKPGTKATTVIGDDTTIREYVTIHRSPFEGGSTSVGSHTLLMAFVHVGHDAQVGNHVTIANHTTLAGHVIVEDGAVLSAHILIHQFCRIGALAMISARNLVHQDVAPYCMLAENGCICGPNTVGLRRAGISSDSRLALKNAIKNYFFRSLNATNAFEAIAAYRLQTPEVEHFVGFIRQTTRGMMPGDPELITLGTHRNDDDEKE